MTDETTGSAPMDPDTVRRVEGIHAREQAREQIRQISEKLREGDINPALEFIAPDEGPKRDAVELSLNNLKPNVTTEVVTENGVQREEIKIEQPEINDDAWQNMLDQWQAAGTTKEEASLIIQISSLEDNDKRTKIQDIESRLGPLSNAEGTDEDGGDTTPVERSQRRAALEEAHSQALAELEDLPEDQKEHYKGKLKRLGLKLTDYFAEGEPGRKYARKGGRILYFALITAVILILLEMNIINKATARGGQRR